MKVLKELRKKKAITQQEAADGLNIDRVSYARYENGTRTPTVEMLARLADFFSVSTDYLLGRTDNPTLYKHNLDMPDNHTAYAITTSNDPIPQNIGERALEFAHKNAIPESALKDDQGKPIDLATWLQDQIRRAVKEELQKQADLEQKGLDNASHQGQK